MTKFVMFCMIFLLIHLCYANGVFFKNSILVNTVSAKSRRELRTFPFSEYCHLRYSDANYHADISFIPEVSSKASIVLAEADLSAGWFWAM